MSILAAEITGHSLISSAGFVITLGVFIILLSALDKAIELSSRLSERRKNPSPPTLRQEVSISSER